MTDAKQVTLSPESERAILNFALKSQQLLTNQYSIRPQMEEIDRYYMREKDYTEENLKARWANRVGDASKIRDVTVPIIMPQVEAALAYYVATFLDGYPTFDIATDPANEAAALQLRTIMGENSVYAGWNRQLTMFFRDGLKYNLHAVECEWAQKTVWDIENTLDSKYQNGAKPKKTLWNGNWLKRMDLYNTFWDPRVHPAEVHSEGEYAGYTDIYSRIRMKKYINDLYGKVDAKTAIRAFESSPVPEVITSTQAPFGYYVPLLNPMPLMYRNNLQTFDWLAWAENLPTKSGISYGNIYHVMKLYFRLLPSDFGLPGPEQNTPQVWKFIIVNGAVVLFAERQSNIHNYIPIFFGQPIEDGLDYQTKSFATNVVDFQDIASAMYNGYMASKRRLIGDRVLYDPSRVREKDINTKNPAAKIPVRNNAFGKPLSEAVYAFPFNDDQTTTLIETADVVSKMADKVNGQNAAQQGQFTKGNRTKHEYDDIMGHGNDHNKVMAMTTEMQVFVPLKETLKLNVMQYQEDVVLFNRAQQQTVQVKTVDIRQSAVHFKVTDGALPDDLVISGDDFAQAMQAMAQNPQLASGYRIAPMFSYLMKERGADLSPFEKSPAQLQYEQALQAWQQAAAQAAQAKAPFSTPMPQPSPQLQQEMQAAQANGGIPPTQNQAIEATQGPGSSQGPNSQTNRTTDSGYQNGRGVSVPMRPAVAQGSGNTPQSGGSR